MTEALPQNEQGFFVMPTFYAEFVHIFSLQPVLQSESMEGRTGRPVQQAPLLVKPARLYELYT